VNARLVADAGAGMAVTPTGAPVDEPAVLGPDDVPGIRAATELILKEPSFRARAGRLADEMRSTPTVTELLGALAP
jgi:hypothetical protein